MKPMLLLLLALTLCAAMLFSCKSDTTDNGKETGDETTAETDGDPATAPVGEGSPLPPNDGENTVADNTDIQ